MLCIKNLEEGETKFNKEEEADIKKEEEVDLRDKEINNKDFKVCHKEMRIILKEEILRWINLRNSLKKVLIIEKM